MFGDNENLNIDKINNNYVRNLSSGSVVMGDLDHVGWIVVKSN